MHLISEYYTVIQSFILIAIIIALSIKIHSVDKKYKKLEDRYLELLRSIACDISKVYRMVKDQKKEPPVSHKPKGTWQA